MKLNIKTYKDRQRMFIMTSLLRVPHFEFMKEDDKNSLQFNFEYVTFQEGDHLQRTVDIPNSMLIIQKGVVEIYTKFNSKRNFAIKYLSSGSVINHTLFLFQ
jgi:CRP-like cAMP-binding protein